MEQLAVVLKVEVAVGCGKAGDNLAHALLDEIPIGLRVRAVPATSAASAMTLVASPAWNCVTDSTAASTGLTDRETIDWERLHQRRADEDRVDGGMRPRGMTADAPHRDLELIGCGQYRPRPEW